jgi:hypothetical protein
MSARLPRNWVSGSAVAAAIGAAAAAAVLAGCGSVQAPGAGAAPNGASSPGRPEGSPGGSGSAGAPDGAASPSASASASGSSPSATACAAAGLRVGLDTAAAGVAAGTYYVPLEFTNTTSHACELAGYPAVAFTSGATGQQIGAEAAVDREARASSVLLPPGATAHAWLQVVNAANYPASKCHPVTAAGLRVVVPGSESASYLPHPVPACKGIVAGSQILTVHPVQQGRARRGTA